MKTITTILTILVAGAALLLSIGCQSVTETWDEIPAPLQATAKTLTSVALDFGAEALAEQSPDLKPWIYLSRDALPLDDASTPLPGAVDDYLATVFVDNPQARTAVTSWLVTLDAQAPPEIAAEAALREDWLLALASAAVEIVPRE